ncbi:conserved hypothetical protein [Pediculus humanus corporis]|uniref:TIMELESS-interacting protein n=1 Tax=Pediculus humanus subsp. corporis TaxID=121224 RepID=E0VXX2_PEDHC|nr:uncharacterized protein Phum_PHUM506330 [Pediculus humanus corporis]EEB18228.1 conserved hypothetical protein [Pediculus humanus corporis]
MDSSDSEDRTSKKDDLKKERKKVINKKPSKRVKLDYNRLSGPNGLDLLKKMFKNFKFKGNNHEKEDLTKVMQILQHWMCNCLFPSGDFEGNMEKLELIGNKRIIQIYMKKIRMGIDDWGESKSNENDIINMDNNFDSLKTDYDKINFDDYNNSPTFEENDWSMPSCSNTLPTEDSNNFINVQGQEENNTFAPQKSQQVQEQEENNTFAPQKSQQVQEQEENNTFAPQKSQQVEILEENNTFSPLKSQPSVHQNEITLTPEQLERIARNRQLAQERKLKRLADQNLSQQND